MQYMFLLYSDPSGWEAMPPDQQEAAMGKYLAYTKELIDAGVMVGGEQLARPDAATTLTVAQGARRVQDGPFIESKESLGGFYLVEVPDLDTAMAWAEKCPGAHHGHVEIRPVILNR